MVTNKEAFYWEDYVETKEPRMNRALIKLKTQDGVEPFYRIVTYDRPLNLWREDIRMYGRFIHQWEIGKIMYLK